MTDLDKLLEERDSAGSKAIVMSFQIMAILTIPVLAVLYIGTYFTLPKVLTFVLCVVALSVSWITVYKIYKKVDILMTGLDEKIKAEKMKLGYDPKVNFKRQKDFDEENKLSK